MYHIKCGELTLKNNCPTRGVAEREVKRLLTTPHFRRIGITEDDLCIVHHANRHGKRRSWSWNHKEEKAKGI